MPRTRPEVATAAFDARPPTCPSTTTNPSVVWAFERQQVDGFAHRVLPCRPVVVNQAMPPPISPSVRQSTQLTVYSKSSMSKLTHEESCGEMQLRACCQMFCHGTSSTRNYSETCARAACRAPRPPHLSTAKDCPAHSLSIRLVRCFFCSHIAGALLYLFGNKAEPALLIWPPTRTLNLGSAGESPSLPLCGS